MLGIPEILFLGFVFVFGVLPVAAGIWALVTLKRIKARQDEMMARQEGIEELTTLKE